jgi:hypothetical protein
MRSLHGSLRRRRGSIGGRGAKLNGRPVQTVRSQTSPDEMHMLMVSTGWWQWFGGTMASIVSLIVILVVLHHLRPTHVDMNPKPALSSAVKANIEEAPIPKFAKEDILELATSIPNVQLASPSAKSPARLDDQLLRRFDEL